MRQIYILSLRTLSVSTILAIVITCAYQGHVMPWFQM